MPLLTVAIHHTNASDAHSDENISRTLFGWAIRDGERLFMFATNIQSDFVVREVGTKLAKT